MFGSKFHPLRVMSGAAGLDIYNGGKGGDTPPTPDYAGLAQQQAQIQQQMNRESLAANRVNQITPYGNMSYSQTGTDQYGNPTYTATQTLSPEQQAIYGKQTGLYGNLLGSAEAGLSNYQQSLENPQIDTSKLPSYGINPGETYSDAIMRRLQPQMAQEQEMFDAKMANQGIAPGTQAYENAARSFQQGQNDKLTSAVIGGMNTGLSANQQAFNQALTNQNLPLNTLNALRSGVQMTQPNYVNSASQQTNTAPNLMGAAQSTYGNQLAAYNANQQANSNFMSGLMGLGGSLLGGGGGGFLGGVVPGVFGGLF